MRARNSASIDIAKSNEQDSRFLSSKQTFKSESTRKKGTNMKNIPATLKKVINIKTAEMQKRLKE